MAGEPKPIALTSPAFRSGEAIPSEYTADGRNVSPPLKWGDLPHARPRHAGLGGRARGLLSRRVVAQAARLLSRRRAACTTGVESASPQRMFWRALWYFRGN